MTLGKTTDKKVDLITVHGTFAGAPGDTGDKWWQKGSAFLTKLQSCLKEDLVIRPFHWSGANSETDRRNAGTKLAETIDQYKEPPIVVGHSHGGSTTIHALAMLAMRRGAAARDAVRGFVSIGTPMILFRSNRNPFTRFSLWGRILLLIALSVGLVYSVSALATIFDPNQFRLPFPNNVFSHLKYFFGSPQPWVAIGFAILLFWYGRRNALRQKIFGSGRLSKIFAGKFTPLSHSQDEAIRALSRGRTLNPTVVKFPMLFGGLFSLFAFGALIMDFGSQILNATLSDRHFYAEERLIGQSLPRTFVVGDAFSPIQFVGMPYEKRAGWRLYDRLRAARAPLRSGYHVMEFSDLWESAEVQAVVAKPDGAWLTSIRDSLPDGHGALLVPMTGDGAADAVYAEFATLLDFIRPYGPDSEHPMNVFFNSGEEEQYRFEDTANYNYLFATENADWMPDFQVPDGISMRGRWIVTLEPMDKVYSSVAPLGAVPQDTVVLLPFETEARREACAQENNRLVASAIVPACGAFGPNRRGEIYKYGLNLWHYKYQIFQALPVPGPVYQFMQWPTDPGTDLVVPELANQSFRVMSVMITLFIFGSAAIAALLAFLLTPVFQGVLTGTLKSTAYGNDGFGEQITDVRPSLDFSDSKVGTIPGAVEEEMLANSRIDAPEALERIRALLAGADLTSLGGADPLSVAMKFEKSELLHNAYFCSDLFVKYVATLLVTKYGLTPSDDLADDLDFEAFKKAMA